MTTNEAENEKDPRGDAPESASGDAPPAAEPETAAAASPEPVEAAPSGAAAEPETAVAAPKGSAPAKPASKAAAMTAGQRLAAARAAKAAKKTAQRGREADEREQRAIDTAEVVREKTVSYLDSNRRMLVGVIGAVALVAVALFGFRKWSEGQEQAAGALLEEANRIQLAAIRSESERASTEDEEEPTFTTRAARAEAALRKYRAVTSEYAGTDAAAWAYLGQGRALLDRGEPAEARAAYQKAIEAGDGDTAVTRQALEGIGFAYEAEENWDEALASYEELGELANGVFETWGEYHAARMLLKKGQEDQAKTRLRAVLERLRGEDAPDAPYLRRQVESRLALLDPSLATQGGAGGGGQLTPQQIQELIRQAQAQQGQSGEPQ